MKQNITLLFALLFVGVNIAFSQQNEEDTATLSIMAEYAKAKNYDAAYKPFMELRQRNPKFHLGIYQHGENILEYKIKNGTGTEKVAFINDLVKLWQERAEYFPNDTPKGKYGAMSCYLMYDNKDILNKTNLELYDCFDAAYKADKATFTNPQHLYTYFSLMVDLYDGGEKPAEDLFNKYDDIVEKIEEEVKNYSEELNTFIEKEEAGTPLTRRDAGLKRRDESYLAAYDQVSAGIDQKLGERANCENLIPLYQKGFEANKDNAEWLKRAVNKMYYKECTEDPLYEQLVRAYDETSPSADTKYFVGTVLWKNGKENEALDYFKQSFELITDKLDKAKAANRIGVILKKKGRYAQARGYFRDALKYNPSNLTPHISIAAMYADSANDCGDTQFNKRAVYWLAADEARKAGGAGAKYVESYMSRAPSKPDIFSAGNAGQTIKIGCWIGASVTVPAIQ